MKIAVVGLGYVGLPLAIEFGKKMPTIGYDISAEKIAAYRRHIDPTSEVNTQDLLATVHLQYHSDPVILKEADFIIVAVPTPVDAAHQPDFTPLIKSSETVGQHLKPGTMWSMNRLYIPGLPRRFAFQFWTSNRA